MTRLNVNEEVRRSYGNQRVTQSHNSPAMWIEGFKDVSSLWFPILGLVVVVLIGAIFGG